MANKNVHAALSNVDKCPEFIVDRAGMRVDVSTDIWRLNDLDTRHTLLNWDRFPKCRDETLEATKTFIQNMIENLSPAATYNAFKHIVPLLSNSKIFSDCETNNSIIPKSIFHERKLPDAENDWTLHYLRQWYIWGADHGYEGFCPEVAFEIEKLRIGGNKKGHAVLSLDPEEGPLDDLEVAGLLNALRAAGKTKTLSIDEQAALWLCVSLGPNAIQPALMREEDLKIFPDEENKPTFFQIDVPRMKKGNAKRRETFRRRPLTLEIANIVQALIEQNKRKRAGGWPHPDFAYPLFIRKNPSDLADGPMREYAMHCTPSEFTKLVSEAVKKLNVISHRTGRPLVVTTRRLRYTFATRLVREGVSKREIADLLDHTDLQNVQVYFDIKSDIVGPLDKALALALGPIGQAFMGKIVRNQASAKRGDDPKSEIAVPDMKNQVIRPVGTCGEFAFCGLMAPVACYTCASFQPWADAPHQILLEQLIADRDRKKAAGLDGRMVTIHDATILAIGDVISRIEAMNMKEPA